MRDYLMKISEAPENAMASLESAGITIITTSTGAVIKGVAAGNPESSVPISKKGLHAAGNHQTVQYSEGFPINDTDMTPISEPQPIPVEIHSSELGIHP